MINSYLKYLTEEDQSNITYSKLENLKDHRKEFFKLMPSLFKTMNKYEHDIHKDTPKKSAEFQYRKYTKRNSMCYIAYDNDEAIGMIVINSYIVKKNTRSGNVDLLYVDEKYRSQGIGKQLFELSKPFFKKTGAKVVQVGTPYMNKRAVEFYKNLGFKPQGLSFIMDL